LLNCQIKLDKSENVEKFHPTLLPTRKKAPTSESPHKRQTSIQQVSWFLDTKPLFPLCVQPTDEQFVWCSGNRPGRSPDNAFVRRPFGIIHLTITTPSRFAVQNNRMSKEKAPAAAGAVFVLH
jgi:hypothetical protein